MENKICMVTGAGSGIGFETAMALAQKKAVVVLVTRDSARGERAVSRIRSRTKNENIFFLQSNFSSLQSVERLADEFKKRFENLHLLINNAAVFEEFYTRTVDRFDNTFLVNYLAPFLLTNLLMERLIGSAPSRIINVSSDKHFSTSFKLNPYLKEREYDPYEAYALSKLYLVMFTYKLAEKLQKTGVTVNAVNPGTALTNLMYDYRRKRRNSGFQWYYRLRYQPPAFSARYIIQLAVSDGFNGFTGKYFSKDREVNSSVSSYNQNNIDRLWNISCELTGLAAVGRKISR